MDLLVAIHPFPEHIKAITRFAEQKLHESPNAHFLYFPWAGSPKHANMDADFIK